MNPHDVAPPPTLCPLDGRKPALGEHGPRDPERASASATHISNVRHPDGVDSARPWLRRDHFPKEHTAIDPHCHPLIAACLPALDRAHDAKVRADSAARELPR